MQKKVCDKVWKFLYVTYSTSPEWRGSISQRWYIDTNDIVIDRFYSSYLRPRPPTMHPNYWNRFLKCLWNGIIVNSLLCLRILSWLLFFPTIINKMTWFLRLFCSWGWEGGKRITVKCNFVLTSKFRFD